MQGSGLCISMREIHVQYFSDTQLKLMITIELFRSKSVLAILEQNYNNLENKVIVFVV